MRLSSGKPAYLQQLLEVRTASEQDQFVGTYLLAVAGKGDVHQVVIPSESLELFGHVLLEVLPLQVEQFVVAAAAPTLRHVLVHRDNESFRINAILAVCFCPFDFHCILATGTLVRNDDRVWVIRLH